MQEPTTTQTKQPMGMRAFTIVWAGQLVSLLGTAMTGFAMTIWAWDISGKATALALVGFFAFGPTVLLSPVAGALVDRWNRKLVMMLSDLAAGLTTIIVLLLFATDNLQIWHLYVTGAFAGAFQAFQFPAYSAAVTMMISKEQYARASGMLSLAQSASGVLAPIAAGALLGPIGISGILVFDIATFVVAVGTLLFVHIPQPKATQAGRAGQGNLWKESVYGFRYIYERPSLLGLQLVFFFTNLVAMFGFTVRNPMILARTGDDAGILASVQSIGAVGGVAGGFLLSVWGGPKRKVHGVLIGMILVSLPGTLLMGLGQGLVVWAVASFAGALIIPIINGSNQAIWQAKVAPDVQGRVFATRRLIAQITAPLAMLMAGPLADQVFEPAMRPGGSLADVFGDLVGTGPGAGMGLMFVISGVLGMLVGLSGYAFRVVREVEDILSDHDSPEAQAERETKEALPWETAPASAGWTLRRKLGVGLVAALLVATFAGLFWLQFTALNAPEEGQVASSVSNDALGGAEQIVSASGAITETTQQPTPQLIQPAVQPTPTLPLVTPTAAPPTPTAFTPLTAGDPLTYTLVVVNKGPSDATAVVVTDTLPAGVTFGSATPSQGGGCNLGDGGILSCDLGTLPNGANAHITVVVTIDALTAGTITSTAAVGSAQADPNRSDNVTAQENVVHAEADLMVQVDVPDLAIAGQTLTYTLTVVNNGPLDATGVTLTDELAAGVTFLSATLGQGGGCSVAQDAGTVLSGQASTVLCDLGDLGSGEGLVVTLVTAVDPSASGVVTSVAIIEANENDLHVLNNVTSSATTVQAQANLVISMDRSEDGQMTDLTIRSRASEPIVAGRALTYTLTISNNGPLDATGITVADTLPTDVVFSSAQPSQGSGCNHGQDGVLSCNLGDLPSGGLATVTVVVLVDAGVTGTITNTAVVSAKEAGLNPADDVVIEESVVTVEADLSIR